MLRHSLRRQLVLLRPLHRSNVQLETKHTFAADLGSEGLELSISEQQLLNDVFDKLLDSSDRQNAPAKTVNTDRNDKHPSGPQLLFEQKQRGGLPAHGILDFAAENKATVAGGAKLAAPELGRYPVSLTPEYFGSIGMDIPSHNFNKLQVSAAVIGDVERTERLKAKVEQALRPHIEYLRKHVVTDETLLQQLQQYLRDFANRDKKFDRPSEQHIEDIEASCQKNPKVLPPPYFLTIPAVLNELFTSKDFAFSDRRRYSLLSMIYQTCKTSRDISMYLQICNVDFYNLLLTYSWRNFQDVRAVNRILQDMNANGIMGDIQTMELLVAVSDKMQYMLDGIFDDTIPEDLHSTGILYCKDVADDVKRINRYLKLLKQTLLEDKAVPKSI
ncbi:AER197Wp [Eremothecium gossypii ATCC 10895]|uniref:AER197Wp n=1 Tax=Eremothecium gossypii (strain ATCC 10895 / CBS 109.51 / FGSC 9923 / NRRL Y-1056) TaxID=284811 RepID=Q756Q7_EREGS|nr:AER197Wp [Eremothecium gossypii ATCC 10895]AAS52878.2 AER197Wp [Eremothecium gossypii ATCC 10895]AEY97185.1 FAER197Wp [Eremothecium gossypii FDAG1]